MKIERDGDKVTTVKKGMIGLRPKIVWEVDGADYKAKGDFFGQELDIERDGKKVARISKKLFSIRDTYGIQIVANENSALIIAAVVCIEQLVGLDSE